MKQTKPRGRPWPVTATAILVLAAGMMTAASPAQAAGTSELVTENVIAINETVSDAGFVHPGVGLSAEDLRTTQEMVRSGQEPWASYFDAMADRLRLQDVPGVELQVRRRAGHGARPELRHAGACAVVRPGTPSAPSPRPSCGHDR